MKTKTPKAKILATSHHRNGVSGDPFQVTLFEDEDGTVKLAVDFGESSLAVLQVDLLAKGDIGFGSNSWRGDYFYHIRKLAEKTPPDVAPDALYITYKLKGQP